MSLKKKKKIIINTDTNNISERAIVDEIYDISVSYRKLIISSLDTI